MNNQGGSALTRLAGTSFSHINARLGGLSRVPYNQGLTNFKVGQGDFFFRAFKNIVSPQMIYFEFVRLLLLTGLVKTMLRSSALIEQ